MKRRLILLGTGIKSISHITVEAKAHIENADKVLFLLNEPLIQEWVIEKSQCAETLDPIYFSSVNRMENYKKITNKIISELKQYQTLCVVCYGHPTVFVQPFIDAAKQALDSNYDVEVVPGISAESCLFADLRIDPGTDGCCAYEATDLILRDRSIDTFAHLIIWQIGVVGNIGTDFEKKNDEAFKILHQKLISLYGEDHDCIVYEAARIPHLPPDIVELKLVELDQVEISPLATLYIPPRNELAQINPRAQKVLIA